MATTNHERVGKALELLTEGLGPFVDREIQGAVKRQRVGADALRPFVDDHWAAPRVSIVPSRTPRCCAPRG